MNLQVATIANKQKSRAAAPNTVPQEPNNRALFRFIDNREESVIQGQLQDVVQRSSRGRRKGKERAREKPVQRFAFIKGTQVKTGDERLTSKEQSDMVKDETVRDYESIEEFKQHAADGTDYIGNLKKGEAGVWVRFHPGGTNALGENHTKVVLDHVLEAVGGTKSFIHERFLDIDETKEQVPSTYALYTSDCQSRDREFGVENVLNKRPFAAETLVPKIGFGMVILYEMMGKDLKLLRSTGNGGPQTDHTGRVLLKTLRQAWAYAEDVVNWFGKDYKSYPDTLLMKKVKLFIPFYLSIKDKVDPFVQLLVYGDALGDKLDTDKWRGLASDLQIFAKLLGDAVYVQTLEYGGSGLDEKDRVQLLKEEEGGVKQTSMKQMNVMNTWRNTAFKRHVLDAIQNGVRYAGMGNEHLKYLLSQTMPGAMHPYDMTNGVMSAFRAKTISLRQKVE